jgi:hypothetical protein
MPSAFESLVVSIQDADNIRDFDHWVAQQGIDWNRKIAIQRDGTLEEWTLLHLLLNTQGRYMVEKLRKLLAHSTTHLLTPIMRGEEQRETPLQWAIDTNIADAVKLILDWAIKSGQGQIIAESFKPSNTLPLQYAIMYNKDAVIPLLIHPRVIDLPNGDITPLEQACKSRKLSIVLRLIDAGARVALVHVDIPALPGDMKKTLGRAIKKQHRTTDDLGCTVLHRAVQNTLFLASDDKPRRASETPAAMVRMLLQLEFEKLIVAQSNTGKTAFDMALSRNDGESVRVLRELGNAKGTAIQLAETLQDTFKRTLATAQPPLTHHLEFLRQNDEALIALVTAPEQFQNRINAPMLGGFINAARAVDGFVNRLDARAKQKLTQTINSITAQTDTLITLCTDLLKKEHQASEATVVALGLRDVPATVVPAAIPPAAAPHPFPQFSPKSAEELQRPPSPPFVQGILLGVVPDDQIDQQAVPPGGILAARPKSPGVMQL